MIIPTAENVLHISLHSLQTLIAPVLKDDAGVSAARTLAHLIRFSALRIENEGQILLDDIHALRELLPEVRQFLAAQDAKQEVSAIDSALDNMQRDPRIYITLAMLADEAGRLRSALYAAQKILIGLKPRLGKQADYLAIREHIRACIGKQIEAESRLVDASFFNNGPRR